VLARALRPGVLARTLAPPAAPEEAKRGEVTARGEVAPRNDRLSVDSSGTLGVAEGPADGERTRGDGAVVARHGLRVPRGVAARAVVICRGLPESTA